MLRALAKSVFLVYQARITLGKTLLINDLRVLSVLETPTAQRLEPASPGFGLQDDCFRRAWRRRFEVPAPIAASPHQELQIDELHQE
jgi:hypothetical protein